MNSLDSSSFQEAIALGLKRASESERIKKEIHEILCEMNAAASKTLNKDFLLFNLSGGHIQQLSPIVFDFNNYSFPIIVKCGGKELVCNSIHEIVEAVRNYFKSSFFGDFMRMNISKDNRDGL